MTKFNLPVPAAEAILSGCLFFLGKRMMKQTILAAAVALGIAASAGSANATLIGDAVTLKVSFNGNSFWGPSTTTVGAGIEFNTSGYFTVDVGASVIDINLITPLSTFGRDFDLVLTDLDWAGLGGQITGINLSTPQGFGTASFTADSVTFSVLASQAPSIGALASIELVVQEVPEPGTMVLYLLGLAGLGFAVSRRKTA